MKFSASFDKKKLSQTSNGVEIIPTVVPHSLADVSAARERYGGITPHLHIDIADGVFAPNTTWTLGPTERLPESGSAAYEVHLMVTHPLQQGLSFVRAGAKRIIAHVESFDHAEQASEVFDMWYKAGAQEIGIAILLATQLEELTFYLQLCDFVHVMTIEKIGKQGFAFDERAIDRVAQLRAKYPDLTISTDGGEKEDNIDDLARAGASRFCVGSTLAKAKDPAKEYSRLLNAAAAV